MSHDRLVSATSNRRDFLRATVATIGISSIPLTASAKSAPEPVGIKGTRRQPVTQKDIENARAQVGDNTPQIATNTNQVMLASNPVPDDGYLAGYALVLKDGVPIEQIFRVSEPQPVSEIKGEPHKIGKQADIQRSESPVPDSSQGISPEKYRQQREQDAHESIEQFLSKAGGE